jgi:hypothetical protein
MGLEVEWRLKLVGEFYPGGVSGAESLFLYKIDMCIGFVVKTIDKFILTALKIVLFGYKLCLSPFFGSRCRFSPTCSDYAMIVLTKHSSFISLFYILKRLFKCHPFHPGGFDPI